MDELLSPLLSIDNYRQNTHPVNNNEVSETRETKQRVLYFNSERLEAFSDAVLSIIATILMTSIRFSFSQMADYNLIELLSEINTAFIYPVSVFVLQLLFFISVFAFIVSAWYRHMKIFYIYPIADNFVLFLNTAFLLACSFLPLVASFLNIGAVPIVIGLLLIPTIVIALVQSTQIVYISFLGSQMPLDPYLSRPLDRKIMTFKIISYFIIPILLLIAYGVSHIDKYGPTIATIMVYFIIFCGNSIVLFEKKYASYRLHKDPSDEFHTKLKTYNNIVSKSRVEFFTDGVFAIVATIIILDATFEITGKIKDSGVNIVPETNVNDIAYGLLKVASTPIFSYLMCFLFVCMFGYVNHSIFHNIRRMTNLMVFINILSLMFLCLIPFCADILVGYANRPGAGNLSLAITLTFTTLFFIGLLQLLLWCVVRFWATDCLTQKLKVVADLQMILSLFLIPASSVVFIFINAFSSHITSMVTLYLFFACVIPTLIFIEFLHFLFNLIAKKMQTRGEKPVVV